MFKSALRRSSPGGELDIQSPTAADPASLYLCISHSRRILDGNIRGVAKSRLRDPGGLAGVRRSSSGYLSKCWHYRYVSSTLDHIRLAHQTGPPKLVAWSHRRVAAWLDQYRLGEQDRSLVSLPSHGHVMVTSMNFLWHVRTLPVTRLSSLTILSGWLADDAHCGANISQRRDGVLASASDTNNTLPPRRDRSEWSN